MNKNLKIKSESNSEIEDQDRVRICIVKEIKRESNSGGTNDMKT